MNLDDVEIGETTTGRISIRVTTKEGEALGVIVDRGHASRIRDALTNLLADDFEPVGDNIIPRDQINFTPPGDVGVKVPTPTVEEVRDILRRH